MEYNLVTDPNGKPCSFCKSTYESPDVEWLIETKNACICSVYITSFGSFALSLGFEVVIEKKDLDPRPPAEVEYDLFAAAMEDMPSAIADLGELFGEKKPRSGSTT